MKQTIEYPGVEPLYFMVLKNPNLWDFTINAVEKVSVIWEKLFLNTHKTRGKKLTIDEEYILEHNPGCIDQYTNLIFIYNSFTEEYKDELCKEWNELCPRKN